MSKVVSGVLLTIIFATLLLCGVVNVNSTQGTSGSVVMCPTLPNDIEYVISIINNGSGLQVAYIDNDGNPVMIQYSGTKFERMFVYKFRNAK